MRRILNFIKKKRDRAIKIFGDVGGSPAELYAVAVALILDDGRIALHAGFLLAESPKKAEALGMVAVFNAWKGKGRIVRYYTCTQVMTPPVLEAVKCEYGLSDGLALWREELEKET